MELADCFPIWDKLTATEQQTLARTAVKRLAPRGTLLHNGSADCVGLFVIGSGQLRAFMLSATGKEVTLYRLFEKDICLFSAACIMQSIQFDITVEAEKDTTLWVIPAAVYKALLNHSLVIANYTNQVLSARFSEVMWLMEQVMWQSFDKRLASFLLTESALENSDTLMLTHEKIASHLGTAREVVTRMLRYFQTGGLVRLARGTIILTDQKGLQALTE